MRSDAEEDMKATGLGRKTEEAKRGHTRAAKAEHQVHRRAAPWSFKGRLAATLPIFLLLLALLFGISTATNVTWNSNAGQSDRTIASISPSTAVRFRPTPRSVDCRGGKKEGLCALSETGRRYRIGKKVLRTTVVRRHTGERQSIRLLLRYPVGFRGKAPGLLLMHGAGSHTITDSFTDVATHFTSAGYYTMAVDKPVWKTNAATRDYSSMADGYEKAIRILRAQPGVDPDAVGCYATSESGWILPQMLEQDRRIAFQILNSPMLFSPRVELGFFVIQDFAIVGSNPGYQGIVRRALETDIHSLGLTDPDISPFDTRSFSIPTFYAEGGRDTMTPQVDGTLRILRLAQKAGNQNVVVRNYPLANHILRIGSQAEPGTKFADGFLHDILVWSNGTVRHERQIAPKVAGDDIHQPIRMPVDAHASRVRAVYLVLLHALAMLGLLVVIVFTLVVLVQKLVRRLRHLPARPLFVPGFGRTLGLVAGTTIVAVGFFALGLAVTIWRVVELDWGSVVQKGGMADWSWYVAQFSCLIVVWSWSSILASFLEIAMRHGKFAWARRFRPRHWRHLATQERSTGGTSGASARQASSEAVEYESGPIIALNREGEAYAGTVMASMFLFLLVFAYWGLFIY